MENLLTFETDVFQFRMNFHRISIIWLAEAL